MIGMCVMMVTGGYVLLPIATPCLYPQCVKVEVASGQQMPARLPPDLQWVMVGTQLACWAEKLRI